MNLRKQLKFYIMRVLTGMLTFILLITLTGLLSSCERVSMDRNKVIQAPDKSRGITPKPSETENATGATPEAIETPVPTLDPAHEPTPEQTSAPTPTPAQEQTPEQSLKPTETPKPTQAPKPTSKPTTTPKPQAGIVNPYVPYTYDQMIAESGKLAEKYPDLLSLESTGTSVEGRELLLIKLGKGEKKIVMLGSHHAREYISSSYLMKMVEEYSKAYTGSGKYGNYNVKELLEEVTLYIVPMVNPDGVNLVNGGLNSVADQDAVETFVMVRPSYREWKANINGVDLNRQYPAYWQEKHDDVGVPASENFKGTDAASESEVQAMKKLTEDNQFLLAASFHTKGNVIYWADEGTVKDIPGAYSMAKDLSALTGYRLMPISKKPSVYGAGYENWFRLEYKRPAFCIELTPSNGTDVPHNDKKFDSLVWNKAKYIGLFLAEEALKR